MTKNGKWKFLNINYNHLDISVKDRGTNYEQLNINWDLGDS